MASLLVSLHEVVEKYIKKASDKELAGKIGTEVLERSRQVAKKYLFTAEDACKFHVALLFPMLSRELLHFTKILRRRMKASTTLSHPWQIRIVRNLPVEIFELLKETILRGGYGITICIQALSVKRNYGLFPVLRTWVCPMKTVRLIGQTCTFDISIFKTTLRWAGLTDYI